MPTLLISGPAQAFAGDPREGDPVTDAKTLVRFHGLVSENACSETFDEAPLSDLGISGGLLRFVVEDGKLRITTAYQVPRKLSDEELEQLAEATRVQWSDGIGEGSFKNWYGWVCSTSLAMAVLNQQPGRDDLGPYFVDPSPMFADGGTRVDFLEADVDKSQMDYALEAAQLGDVQAQFAVGRHLEDGDGIDKNESLAFENYQKAAAQGHLPALTFVGRCHEKGIGTSQDLEQGVACYRQAAEAGLTLAMHHLADCYFEGKGVAADPAEAIRWYQRGADLGDLGCTAEMGDVHEFGKGVPIDLHKALEFYQRCSDGGWDDVMAEPLARVKAAPGS